MTQPYLTKDEIIDILSHAQSSINDWADEEPVKSGQAQAVLHRAWPLLEAAPGLLSMCKDFLAAVEEAMIEADPQAPTTIEWAELDETRQLLAQFDGRPITNEQKEVNT